jgi:hypothetical protein
MRFSLLCLAVGTAMLVSSHSVANTDALEHIVKDGSYVGLKAENYADPEEPNAQWFHENRLLIRSDEAILDKVPVIVSHGKKQYSASDGGFFTYRGRFSKKDGQIFVALRLCQSDYVLFPADKYDQYIEVKTHRVTITNNGLEFDGVKYAPAKLHKLVTDRLLKLLSTEPLEKAGAN